LHNQLTTTNLLFWDCFLLFLHIRHKHIGPGGSPVPAQVLERAKNTFGVEFNPRVPGEHRVSVLLKRNHVPGSPFACKVYDVNAIKVKDTDKGFVGKPVTFLGKKI